jgi:hypothetical protein
MSHVRTTARMARPGKVRHRNCRHIEDHFLVGAARVCEPNRIHIAINWRRQGVNPDRVSHRVARGPLCLKSLIRLPGIAPFRLRFRSMSHLGNACGGPCAHTSNKPQQIATEHEPCFGRG